MNKIIEKKIKSYNKDIFDNLTEDLRLNVIPAAREIIIEDYDFSLNDIANPKSKLAPERFMDEFRRRLDDFEYIGKTSRGGVKIICPDMDNFDFRGSLQTIKNILEGIAGIYVEVERRDYVQATKKETYQGRRDEVFLVRYTAEVRKWERMLDKKFEPYAFSNTPPIDIFTRSCKYIEDNLDGWIDDAINKSTRGIK